MADWRDVMEARSSADNCRLQMQTYGSQIEDGDRTGDVTLGLMLLGDAVCAELRALAMLIDNRAS